MLKEHRTSVPPVAHCLTCREEVKFFEMGRRFARCASMIRRKNVRFVAPKMTGAGPCRTGTWNRGLKALFLIALIERALQ